MPFLSQLAQPYCRLPIGGNQIIEFPSFTFRTKGVDKITFLDHQGQHIKTVGKKEWENNPGQTMALIMSAIAVGFDKGMPTPNEDGHCYLTIGNQNQAFRFPNPEEGVDFIDLLDEEGAPLTSWSCDEWESEPEFVMGAIMGALANGFANVQSTNKSS